MKNKRNGIIPIININSRNLGTGDFGEYLTLINYSELDKNEIDLKNSPDLENYNTNVLSTTFKYNKMNPNLDTIDTSKLPVPNQSLAKNKIKYITSLPLNKELVMPIPEQFTNPNPTTLQIIKEPVDNGSWFLNTCIFQNGSIIMPNDNTTLDNSGSKIKNELSFKLFFNTDIEFTYLDLESNTEINKIFRFTFKFIFSTPFLSTFVTTFEYFNYFKEDLLNFLIQNKSIILKIEENNNIIRDNINLSYLLDSLISENNLKINNINLKDFKIIKDTEFYFNFETFKKSRKVYNCTFKLIPQDYISLISENEIDIEAIQKNMNNFYQSFTNENILIFDNFIKADLLNKSEEINILNISTDLNKDTDINNPDYIKLKNFISGSLINFINEFNIFPKTDNMNSIPTEISYNIYDDKIKDIGKRQIIIKFTNSIILTESGIPSDIYIIQYNILENRLEIIPVLTENDISIFNTNTEILKSINYNKENLLKSFKLFNSFNLENNEILDSTYNKFIIYNNTDKLNKITTDQNTLNTNKETNKYRLKIIKNYNLTQNQINELSENNISVSGLTYSSYALSTIYVS